MSRTPPTKAGPAFVRTAVLCAATVIAVIGGYVLTGALILSVVPDPVLGTFVTDLVAAAVAATVRWRRPHWLAINTAPGPASTRSGRSWLLWTGCLVMAFLAGQTASAWLYGVAGSPGYDRTVQAHQGVPVAVLLVFSLLVAPISEELILRGTLYPLLRRFVSPLTATILVTSVFCLLHGNLVQGIVVVPLGVLLAVVYERTRSIVAVAGLHVLFNLAAATVPPAAIAGLATPPVVATSVVLFGVLLALAWRATDPAVPGASDTGHADRQ